MRLAPTITVLLVSMTTALPAQDAREGRRDAEQICRDFDAIQTPSLIRPEQQAAVRRQKETKARLVAELLRSWPAHERLPALLLWRWSTMIWSFDQAKLVLDEVEPYLADTTEPFDLLRNARLSRARALLELRRGTDECVEAARLYLEVDAKSAVGGHLLFELVKTHRLPDELARTLIERIGESFAEDKRLANAVRGYRSVAGKIGKPLLHEFDDLLTGATITTATSPVPYTLCIYWSTQPPAESAAINELLATRDDLRVIGIVTFRVEGGPEKARELLQSRDIAWPTRYDAERIKSPFTTPYRVPTEPFYFLLDEHGRVVRFAYTFRVMRTMLDELAAPKKGSAQ